MFNLGVVQQSATIFIPFDTAAADGGAEGFSATIEAADFDIYKNGSATQRTSTAGFTVAETFDTVTGLHGLTVDLSDNTDAGFYSAGDTFDVSLTPDETIDAQTVAKWIGRFTLESDAQLGSRRLSTLYANHTVGATGNTTTAVHLSGIATTVGDDEIIGEILLLYDVDATEWHFARITDFANTGDLATVESLQGGALPFTPASGDYWFRVGVDPKYATLRSFVDNTLAESYAADGAEGTPAQLLYLILGLLSEFARSGTTVTVRQLDGSTSAATFTLDDATTPTSITRAS